MYEIIFYDTADGKCPVQDFLDSLEPKFLAKTLRTIDLLETNGPLLREPYSKLLENGIFELRTKHGSDINRVFYFFIIGQKIILTNGIIKKTAKTSQTAKNAVPEPIARTAMPYVPHTKASIMHKRNKKVCM